MAMKLIAHVTDAHIGQRVLPGGENGSDKMNYGNEPEEHKANLKAVFDDLAKRKITELVFGGDIGTRQANPWFFAAVEKYKFDLSMVLGNHDLFSEVHRHYRSQHLQGSGEMNYAREDDDFKYVYLDSSSNAISDAQFDWLKQRLNGGKKLLLFLHHPVLKIDTPLDRQGAALKDREKIKHALHDCQNEVSVFCGHYHMQDEAIDGNIRQFLTPAVSYQIEKRSAAIDRRSFGYRLIEIDGSDVRTSLVMFQITARHWQGRARR
jgi:3',5'-cyclic-AMP phosphodiesterase